MFFAKETEDSTGSIGLLKKNLFCDNFQFLPETSSLLPVIQFLIQYPEFVTVYSNNPTHRNSIALLCLKLFISEPSSRDIINLTKLVKDFNSKNAAETIRELNSKLGNTKSSDLYDRLSGKMSLQDKYVLMLYWILRKNNIKDFSYKANKLTISDTEPIIDKSVSPEKQHIIPYSRLRKIYQEISEGTRLSTHEVNNIGNITFISHDMNSWDALGGEPFNLKDEPSDNLIRHFLLKPNQLGKRSSIQAEYSAIDRGTREDVENEVRGQLTKRFEKFCDLRRNLITKGFFDWIKDLENNLSIDYNISPTKPLFVNKGIEPKSTDLPKLQIQIKDIVIEILGNKVIDSKFVGVTLYRKEKWVFGNFQFGFAYETTGIGVRITPSEINNMDSKTRNKYQHELSQNITEFINSKLKEHKYNHDFGNQWWPIEYEIPIDRKKEWDKFVKSVLEEITKMATQLSPILDEFVKQKK